MYLRTACLLILTTTPMLAQDLAFWRGDGTGVFPKQAPPTSWTNDQGIAWRVPLPNWSNSSPIIANGRVFLTSETREAFPELLCLDADSGKEQWRFILDPLKDTELRQQWTTVNLHMRDLLELRGERLWIHETKPADAGARLSALQERAKQQGAIWDSAEPDVKKDYFKISSQKLKDMFKGRLFDKHGLRFASWGIRVQNHRGQTYANGFQYHDYYNNNSGTTWVGHAHPTPVLIDRTVYVLTAFNALHAIDIDTGTQRWLLRFPQPSKEEMDIRKGLVRGLNGMWFSYSPIVANGKVITLAAGYLRAIDPKAGKELWSVPVTRWTQHQRNNPGIVRVGDTELIGLANGKLYHPADGRVVIDDLESIGKDSGVWLTHQNLVLNSYCVHEISQDGNGFKATRLHWWGQADRGKHRRGHFRPAGTKSEDYVCLQGKVYPGQACWDMRTGKELRKADWGTATYDGSPLVASDTALFCLSIKDRYRKNPRTLVRRGGLVTVYELTSGNILGQNQLEPAPASADKLRQYWRNGEVTSWRHFGAAAPFIWKNRLYIRSYDELICIGQ